MHEFNVGDLVRIRQWDDMAFEYGVIRGFIKTPVYTFISDMRYLCGKEFTITSIGKQGDREVFGHGVHWHITIDMIELVEDDATYDSEEIENFLGTIHVNQ